jgi:hypothetical protein
MKSTPSSRISWLKAVHGDRHITGTEFRVAWAIADHVNNVTGYAFPAAERLAKQMHLSAKTVRRSVSSLLRHGYLKVGPRLYKSVTYILTLNHRPVPIEVHASDNRGLARSQIAALEPATRDHQTYSKPTNKTYDDAGIALGEGTPSDTIEADVKKLCSPYLGKCDRLLDSTKRPRYEPELRERLGSEADLILSLLPEICVEQLLQLVKSGALMTKDIWMARSIANQIRRKMAS